MLVSLLLALVRAALPRQLVQGDGTAGKEPDSLRVIPRARMVRRVQNPTVSSVS